MIEQDILFDDGKSMQTYASLKWTVLNIYAQA